MSTGFKVVTDNYLYIFFITNFGKFKDVNCIFCVMIIVSAIKYFTFIKIKLHLPLL